MVWSCHIFATAADCTIGPSLISWCSIRIHCWHQLSDVDHCAPAPMTSECHRCHAHTIDSEIEFSQPLATSGGTIYHLYCDSQTWHFLFLSRDWKCTCLVLLIPVPLTSLYLMCFNIYKYCMTGTLAYCLVCTVDSLAATADCMSVKSLNDLTCQH